MARPRTGARLYRLDCDAHGGKCWRGVYYDHAGQRRFTRLHGLSKPDARAILDREAAQAALDRAGVTSRADRVTVREYYRQVYLPALIRAADLDPRTLKPKLDGGERASVERITRSGGRLKESTVLKRMEHIELHWLPLVGSLPLSALTDATVEPARMRLRVLHGPRKGERPSPATMRSIDGGLSALVHHAARMGYFGAEAADAERRGQWVKPWVSPEKVRGYARPSLRTEDEQVNIIRIAHEEGGLAAACVVMLAIIAGCRRGEMRHFRRDHFWVEGDSVVGHVPPHATKTGKPYNIVLLGTPRELFVRYLEELAREVPHTEWLFPVRRRSRWKERRGRSVVWFVAEPGDQRRDYALSDALWNRIKRRSGFTGRVHDLKGTFIKSLARKGFSMEELRLAAKHSHRETLEHYLQDVVGPEERRIGEAFAQLPLDLEEFAAGGELDLEDEGGVL